METENLSYLKNKGNYTTTNNLKNNVKIIYNLKRINVIIMILIFLFISLVPVTKVEAATKPVTYTQKLTNGIESFPEDYQKLLNEFVDDTFHDNWTFQAYYTGIDWNDFIQGEKNYNRVYKGFDVAHRCTCGDLQSGYYCANSEITSYFIDPRNFINERNLFQFLEISYNEELYTEEIVGKLVAKYEVFNKGEDITFVMSDENHKDYNKEVTMSYTDIIMAAAKKSKMSPISMIIKIVQEVGAEGSASTDGKHALYPNTYNFFNIGSSDTGDAIKNGLKHADEEGWHCPYTSIVEGAMFNSDNYIQAGQNTAYFYKYDCVGKEILKAGQTQTISKSDLYHQYMTNIQDPYSQSAALFSTYTNNDLLDENLNFIIPVFENMPKNPVNKISSLSNSDKELYFADVTSSLYVRETPSTSAKSIRTIYKDDLVVMLERNHEKVGTSYWDKVQLWDGRIGYTMSKYLEPFVPYEEEIPEEDDKKEDSTTGDSTKPENSGSTSGGTTGGATGGTTDDANKVPEDNTNTENNNTSKPETDVEEEEKEPVDQVPLAHIGYGFADVSTTLNVRKGAGTSYGIAYSLNAKQEFIILEETDNWYKIQFDGNKKGYVSKEYAKSLEYMKVDETNKKIKVIPNITADIVAGKIGAKKYSVKKAKEEILDNSIGTGYVINLDDKEYTIVKMGDVNGDGDVNARDSLRILKYSVSSYELKGDFKTAADISGNGTIDSRDSLRVLKHVVNTFNATL